MQQSIDFRLMAELLRMGFLPAAMVDDPRKKGFPLNQTEGAYPMARGGGGGSIFDRVQVNRAGERTYGHFDPWLKSPPTPYDNPPPRSEGLKEYHDAVRRYYHKDVPDR